MKKSSNYELSKEQLNEVKSLIDKYHNLNINSKPKTVNLYDIFNVIQNENIQIKHIEIYGYSD